MQVAAFRPAMVPGQPTLRIFLTDTNTVVVAWPPATGFMLQQNSDLATSSWGNVTNVVQSGGAEDYVVLQRSIGPQFYRLKHP